MARHRIRADIERMAFAGRRSRNIRSLSAAPLNPD
jgi:hypothetical protein